jgi:hypothetical protein
MLIKSNISKHIFISGNILKSEKYVQVLLSILEQRRPGGRPAQKQIVLPSPIAPILGNISS